MRKYFTGFRWWALTSCIVVPPIALVIPTQFDSMGWLWLLVPPAMVLFVVTAISFAFIFTDPKLSTAVLQVSRFSRTTFILLTAGFGYLDGWLYYCAGENGCDSRLAVIPGTVFLIGALIMLYRFRYKISAA